MKVFDIQAITDEAGAPRWVITVATDGGAAAPAPGDLTYGSREEAETEAERLDLEQSGKDGP